MPTKGCKDFNYLGQHFTSHQLILDLTLNIFGAHGTPIPDWPLLQTILEINWLRLKRKEEEFSLFLTKKWDWKTSC